MRNVVALFAVAVFGFVSGMYYDSRSNDAFEKISKDREYIAELNGNIAKDQIENATSRLKLFKASGVSVYPVNLIGVVDGDTMDIEIEVWNDITITKRIRLLGVDTPELHPHEGTDAEKSIEITNAKKAKEFTLAATQKNVLYFASSGKNDSFGRSLGYVLWIDGDKAYNLGEELLKSGLAKTFKK